MDSKRHEGKSALVTGAGSGIGRATVVRLAAEDARVIACDVDEEGLALTVQDAGPGATAVIADITDQAAVDAVFGDITRLDILVNNAGVMDHFLPITETDDATWNHVLAVNLTGVMRLTRAALPLMEQHGSGAVITVGSEGSLSGGVSGVSYASSKHGVLGLVRHVAYYYGPKGIRSNAVLPGAVATGIGRTAAPESQWAIERSAAALATMPPMADPDQIAAVISWLACDEASNVNGAMVTADGGWSAA